MMSATIRPACPLDAAAALPRAEEGPAVSVAGPFKCPPVLADVMGEPLGSHNREGTYEHEQVHRLCPPVRRRATVHRLRCEQRNRHERCTSVRTMMSRTALALGAAGLVFLAACGSDGGTTASESATVTEVSRSETTESADSTAEETPDTTAAEEAPATTEADEAPATTEAPRGGPLASISGSGFVTFEAIGETWANLAALVQNETDEDLFYVEVTYNIIGADGSPVATESSIITTLPAGQAVPTTGTSTTDLTAAMPVSIEVTAFAEEESFFESDWVELEVSVEPAFVVGEYGSTSVSGTVTNTSDAPTDFYDLVCLVRSPDGTVLGGFQTFPDTAAPGQTIAWESSGSGDFDAFVALGGTVGECSAILDLD